MKKLILVGLLGWGALSAFAGDPVVEVIECESLPHQRTLHLKARFDTEDLRGVARVYLQGDALYRGFNQTKERCDAFTVRGKVYYNTYTIHTTGCDLWQCSLHTPDTIHGERVPHFPAKLSCFDPSFKTERKRKIALNCSTYFERVKLRR